MRLKGVKFLTATIFLLLEFSLTTTAYALNRRLTTEDKSGSIVLSKFNYSQSGGGLFSGHGSSSRRGEYRYACPVGECRGQNDLPPRILIESMGAEPIRLGTITILKGRPGASA